MRKTDTVAIDVPDIGMLYLIQPRSSLLFIFKVGILFLVSNVVLTGFWIGFSLIIFVIVLTVTFLVLENGLDDPPRATFSAPLPS